MKTLIPENNTVLCVKEVPEHEVIKLGNFEYARNNLPLYRIERSSLSSDQFKPGDLIAVDSTGTSVGCDGHEYYIFRFENIAAKVAD